MSTHYLHLGVDERAHIQLFTARAIARAVNRAPSAIGRELVMGAGAPVRASWVIG